MCIVADEMSEKNILLDSIYNNINNEAGLSGIEKLLKEARKYDDSISINDVTNYLKTSNVYTLHKIQPKRFVRRFNLVAKPGIIICSDVAYMTNISTYNNNVKYLIFFLDLFSKHLTIKPVKKLKSECMVKAFKDFFGESIYKYSRCFTDEGGSIFQHL